jgi:hypothetical protein
VAILRGKREENVEFDWAQGHIGVRRLYAPRIHVNGGLDGGRWRKV